MARHTVVVKTFDPKGDLHAYLRSARAVMLWKLDGLTDYDVRRPLVPTGTNLLGLVRHVAGAEAGYFGLVFGRPFVDPLPWTDGGEPNSDMWVRAGVATQDVIDFCHRAWAHADATIHELSLDAVGEVPWWPEGERQISLHHALVHVLADVERHAGHADILREQIDGSVGMDPRWSNLPPGDDAWWAAHHDQIAAAAQAARDVT
jgi:hypothetical protein